jgi:uncharacterized protein with GYD domain
MPTYVVLVKWTEQGRRDVGTLVDRARRVREQAEKLGVKPIAQLVTMGRYDQIVVSEAPDDETMAKVVLMVAGQGNAVTETLRSFTMDEVGQLL